MFNQSQLTPTQAPMLASQNIHTHTLNVADGCATPAGLFRGRGRDLCVKKKEKKEKQLKSAAQETEWCPSAIQTHVHLFGH